LRNADAIRARASGSIPSEGLVRSLNSLNARDIQMRVIKPLIAGTFLVFAITVMSILAATVIFAAE